MPMAGSITISISSLSALNIGGSARAEASEILWMVEVGLAQLVSSHATNITLKDRNGNTAGTITWSQVNSR